MAISQARHDLLPQLRPNECGKDRVAITLLALQVFKLAP
jgi:hypothetical protein